MKIRRSTIRTRTILEPRMAKLTRVKLTVIEMIIFSCPATFGTWHILFRRLAMDTLRSMTKLKWIVMIVDFETF